MIPVLLYEGVSGFEALGALAALRAAGLEAELAGADALVPTREGARLVPARMGLAPLGSADAVVIPGGDTARLMADAEAARQLRSRRARWTLASGDAIHLLARVGLTEARRVARPPDGRTPLGAEAVAPARLVADARLLTCTGGDALVDLVLHFVAHEQGADAARRAADSLGRSWAPFAMGATESRA